MRSYLLALMVLFGSASFAQDLKVQICEEAGVDLTSLILPAAANSKTFYKNDVSVFGIDQLEPACCSYGVAITVPDPDAELGGVKKCYAIIGLGGIDVGAATAQYDPKAGLSVSIPARGYNPEKGSVPRSPLNLLLNLKKGSITIR